MQKNVLFKNGASPPLRDNYRTVGKIIDVGKEKELTTEDTEIPEENLERKKEGSRRGAEKSSCRKEERNNSKSNKLLKKRDQLIWLGLLVYWSF